MVASIITEVYGFTLAGRIIWVQLMCQALFISTVNLFVLLPSSDGSMVALHYLDIYQNFWHVLIASTISIIFAYFINDIIISALKIYLSGRYFLLRLLISNAIGNAVLVSIAYPINFYGLYSYSHIARIALNTWVYKMILAIVLFPIAILFANAIKRIEKLDYFDYGVSYNPVTVFSENISGKNNYNTNNSKGWNYEGNSN